MNDTRISATRVGAALVIVILLLSFFFIWPGVWRYEYFCFQTTDKDDYGHVLGYGLDCFRADRLTGKIHYLDVEGWH